VADKEEITPLKKAAIIMIALGTQTAAEVMKHLSDREIELLSIEIAQLKEVSAETLGEVIEEFYQLTLTNQYIIQGGIDYAREVLETAYGKEKAEELIEKVEAATEVSAFHMLQNMDEKQLISFLESENPQTAALILANLKPKQAASILSQLPENMQADIAYRIATMERTSPEFVRDIEQILKQQIDTAFGADLKKLGGTEAVASILNSVNRSAEKAILESIRDRDPELADEISSMMFLFEDIVKLSDFAVQRILKEVDTKTLAMALKAANDELKEKVLRNVSERVAEMLKDEMEYLGPVRVRDVENAQKRIVEVVRELEQAGEIDLTTEEEEIIE